jgi:hypothetical protein
MTTKKPPTSRKLVPQTAGPVDKRRRKRGLTVAVRTAIDAMLYDRCTRAQACERAGFTERALYLALEKPEVATYFNRGLQVLRAGERAQNLHRLADLRDQDDNRAAAVKAIQVLEMLDAEAVARPAGVPTTPGVTIRIVNVVPSAPRPSTVDVTPNAEPFVPFKPFE